MARLLTTGSVIQCAHGAPATLTTGNQRVSAGARVLLESDVHGVTGCPFYRGDRASPCTTIEWQAGASRATVGGTAPLHQDSVGTCKNGEGLIQGTALVATTQPRVSAS